MKKSRASPSVNQFVLTFSTDPTQFHLLGKHHHSNVGPLTRRYKNKSLKTSQKYNRGQNYSERQGVKNVTRAGVTSGSAWLLKCCKIGELAPLISDTQSPGGPTRLLLLGTDLGEQFSLSLSKPPSETNINLFINNTDSWIAKWASGENPAGNTG